MKPYVTVVGSINYDFFLQIDHAPQIGETMHARKLAMSCGGKGANQAYQLGKLGANVHMIGSVGNDIYGDHSIQALQDVNVSTNNILRVPTNTGLGFVTVLENGEVQAIIDKGANDYVTIDVIQRAYDLIFGSDLIVLQLEIPLDTVYYILKESKKHQCKIVLNPAPAQPIPNDLLMEVDYLIVNEVEAAYYLNVKDVNEDSTELMKKLQKRIKDTLIITLGSKGSYVIKDTITHIPIVPTNAIDTTGAGDSYIGAFVYGIMNGNSVIDACKMGAKSSAKTIQSFGRESVPSQL